MKNVLMVPVHLDAMYLTSDRLVIGAMADFSRLPYFDGTRDVNSNIANISEEIVSQPYQNHNLYLKAGIHLHWALPDALTKGIQVSDNNKQTKTTFPPVPNRWLVTRSKGDNIEQQWIVESDYLYPKGNGIKVSSIAYPIEVKKDERQQQPFRYLGRKVRLAHWQEDEAKAEYLSSLTAVGYGEPTFAAFYPNCHSVFGFHDHDYAAEIPHGLQYDIIGWYSEAQQTCLQDFLDKLKNTLKQQGYKTPINDQKLIEEEFKWKVNLEANEFPEPLHFICYASLNFPQGNKNTVNSDKQAPVKVTVGNTGTEALSAYLGKKIDSDRKSIIEDQLEALHLSSYLEHRQLDITPKFKEARHEKGFNPIAAGTMWTIRSENLDLTTAKTEDAHNQTQLTLPNDMADLLNELNLNQQKYDCALHEIESMRRQLFSDWYKYMLSAYPPEGSKDQYPDIDEVKHYIKMKGIAPLQAKLTATGNLMLSEDNSGKLAAEGSPVTSIAFLLAGNINKLLRAIAGENIKQCQWDLKVSDIRDWSAFISKLQLEEEPIKKIKELIPSLAIQIKQFKKIIQDIALIKQGLDQLHQESENSTKKKELEEANKELGNSNQKVESANQNVQESEILLKTIRDNIINALNLILKKREFYQEAVFGKVTLSAEAELLKKKQLKLTEQELACFNRLLLEASFPQLIIKVPNPYSLRQISSPRYWEPKEPVLLMTGEAVKPSPRHGQDGRLQEDGCLQCQILVLNDVPIIKNDFSTIRNKIDEIKKSHTGEHIAFSSWEKQPWHPFLLEWEVEVFPIREGSNHITHNSNYDHEFITSNYVLKENEPDLSVQSGKGAIVKVANVYTGRSILTPHAGIKLKEQLEAYLQKELLDKYHELKHLEKGKEDYSQKIKVWCDKYHELKHFEEGKQDYSQKIKVWCDNMPSSPALDERLKKLYGKKQSPPILEESTNSKNNIKEEIDNLETWYKKKPSYKENNSDLLFSNLSPEEQAKDPIYTAIRAYQSLLTLNFLSQSLGGFNEALLMHKQTMQLPITDPLGFTEYQLFTNEVRNTVQQSIRSAPEPLNDFNPIRSGVMQILRLRLVDTFGQVKELDVKDIKDIITTEQMMIPQNPRLVSLAPRLVQPARLNFRWLSASQGEQEMNSHPVTTPICGWILPNNLDKSLAIYDNQGKVLGSINQLAQWESAPGSGSDRPISSNDILNSYLKKVVNYLSLPKDEIDPVQIKRKRDFLKNFILALDSGLENIDPENFAQHQSLALLMGLPIAVVRASLNLELQELPAINQNWNVFWHDLRRDHRKTDGFEQVKIPIRLGEYKQLNDGLLGYWLEDGDRLSDVFYASQSDSDQSDSEKINDTHIKFHSSDNPWHIDLNLKDAPKMFTMLIDPRGKVHATCGILPTKAINIPLDQYQQVLEKIEITFLSTPILTDLISLSDLTSLHKKINLSLPVEPGYEWSWLEKKKGQWLVISADKIGQVNPNAVFSGKQAIREGWLKLSPAKNTQNSISQGITEK